ncbi:hypothetical protein [Ulvibacter litoralis]|uniref:Uncharacterized protein n=1 Tax=Ulvibacter litoralis TaxID=227084 RepID=A0A1G7EWN2_9FLAO|nr:hypothetical protein [Ulvibacter litoralis]GHC53692.1 hypothetical protein GCM10008083_17230 [Ulvibacter litoralis]SDE67846.1 hypothetical protein SAMN05421855_102177 [Ulvibacter litoralis]
MKLSIFMDTFNPVNSIDSFVNYYYSLQMHFLASDLLEKGLSQQQISEAILKAMKVGKSSGIEIRKHFMPIFSQRQNEIIKDCKLSSLGYGLVVMNADANLPVVGDFQVGMLTNFLADKF